MNDLQLRLLIVIIWKVQNIFDLESISAISSCTPSVLMIHGVEVLFLSPVGYVFLQSLSPEVESCSSCSFCSAVEDVASLHVSSICLSSPSFQLQFS